MSNNPCFQEKLSGTLSFILFFSLFSRTENNILRVRAKGHFASEIGLRKFFFVKSLPESKQSGQSTNRVRSPLELPIGSALNVPS